MIACDTSALSHFFRRAPVREDPVSDAVEKLIEDRSAVLFGIVRQELLSGIKHQTNFDRIEIALRSLPVFFAEDEDHITAARFYNSCRAKGIQDSTVDFLICAMAVRRGFKIYTTDPDFLFYEPIIPIELHRP